MDRRRFLKAAVATGAMATATAWAGPYEEVPKRGTEPGGLRGQGKTNPYLRLQDAKNPTVSEQKHVPGIDSPDRVPAGGWFDVQVRVGFQKEHPSIPEHWITRIELRVDGRTVGDATFPAGGVSSPSVTFRIRVDADATLEAVEHCNLHGTWISQPVSVRVG